MRRREAVVASSPSWDGQVGVLQVTKLGKETMQTRSFFRAANSSRSSTLQCEVREGMIDFLQHHHPGCLPHRRTYVQLSSSGARETGSEELDPDRPATGAGDPDGQGGALGRTAGHRAAPQGNSPPASSSGPGPWTWSAPSAGGSRSHAPSISNTSSPSGRKRPRGGQQP